MLRGRTQMSLRSSELRRSVLQQRDRAEAAVGTYAHDGAAAMRQSGELLDGLAQNARAGRSKGMAKGNAAAVGIHPVAREAAKRVLEASLFADIVFILEA